MTKKDYREKIEEGRQQIELDDDLSRLSRSKRKTKKRKSPLMSILLVTFILIPLSVLIYVNFFYEPTIETKEKPTVNNETVQMETNNAANNKSDDEDKEEQADSDEKLKEDQKEDEKDIADAKAKKEAELVAAKKAENEAAKKAKEEAAAKKAAEEAAAKKAAEQQAKSHVVQTGDTLYSIAMKYYGYPEAVEKIKAANNLKSDSISTGHNLVLP